MNNAWRKLRERALGTALVFGLNLLGWVLGTPLSSFGAQSAQIGLTVHMKNPPNAVTDLVAAPVGSLDGDALLTWTAPRNLNGAPIDHYIVRWATFPASSVSNAENWWNFVSTSAQQQVSPAHAPGVIEFFTLHGLTIDTLYYFGIKSIDADNSISPIDSRVGLPNQAQTRPLNTTPGAPNTPTNFIGIALSTSSIQWTWDPMSRASFYTMNAYPSGAQITQTTLNTFTESGLTPNAPLSRTITAGNGSGLSAATAAQTVYTLAAVPTNLSISNVKFNGASLSWNKSGNPLNTQYRVERSLDGVSFAPLSLTSTQPFVDSGLTQLTVYYYRVRAINGDGILSNPSVSVSTTTPPQIDFVPPTEPRGLKGILDPSGKAFTLSWEPVTTNVDDTATTDLAGYNVYRRTSLASAPIRLTPAPITVTAFADQVDNKVYYYTIRAIDYSGNESAESLFADSSVDANVIYVASDSISSVIMPQSVNDLLRSKYNKYGVPLTIRLTEQPIPDQTSIIREVKLYLVKAETQEVLNDMSFSKPQATIAIGYNMVNGQIGRGSPLAKSVNGQAGLSPDQLSIFWNNGVSWVKIGGTLDSIGQAIKTKSSYLGRYQLRSLARSTELSLDQANVFPRVFTPNGDGFNDRVYFVLENPGNVQVQGSIYDAAGRFIVNLPPPAANAGIGTTLTWDGKDFNGGRVPSGVYYYKIEGSGKSFTGTVAVAR